MKLNQVIELLKEKQYQIPFSLLKKYRLLGISDSELIILIYLINSNKTTYNPKEISDSLNIPINEILEIVNSLSQKSILSIDMKVKNNIRSEFINLDNLYSKLAFKLLDTEEESSDKKIYQVFETELGRTLSPMEYEIINGWLSSGSSEETILLALKEAVYNGVSNMRYIDRIIYEWKRKDIKNKEDIIKDKNNYRNNKKKNVDVFDYNWLEDE